MILHNESPDIFNLLIGPFLIFGIIYFILTILAFIRLLSLISSNGMKIGKLFYLNVIVVCIFRSISSSYLLYVSISFLKGNGPYSNEKFSSIFFNILYVPDFIFWNCLAFLYWQLLILFYKGHLHLDFEDSIGIHKNKKGTSFKINYSCLFMLFITCCMIIQIVFFALSANSDISQESFLIENSIFNLLLPFILFLTELFLHIQYSGLPYRSIFDSENKGKINKRIVFWGLARSIHGGLDILIVCAKIKYDDYLVGSISSGQFIFAMFVIVGEKILTEIVPCILVFDMDFMSVFFNFTLKGTISSDHEEKLLIDNYNRPSNFRTLSFENSKNMSQDQSDFEGMNNNMDQSKGKVFNLMIDNTTLNFRIDIDLLSLDNSFIEKKRNNGLGKINLYFFYSMEKVNKYFVRDITISKLSKYIMEETLKDMHFLINIQTQYPNLLVNLKGYDYKSSLNRFFLFYDYDSSHNGSLFEKKSEIFKSNEQKVVFLLTLARSFNILHNLDPPLIHGHFSSNNIMLDKSNNPRIADLSLLSLKKFANIYAGYTHKTAYTPPEYLKDKGFVVQNPRKAGDVYAFGLIMWELFTEKQPFPKIKLKELRKFVCEEKSRPKIPPNIPEEIANLIRVCWQEEEEKRPSFSTLIRTLENMINPFE